jgi:uncharacterized membrane protein YdjX (TVP38/TMEM64 family)
VTPPPPTLVQRLGPAAYVGVASFLFPILGSVALFATAGVTGPWLREHGMVGLAVFTAAFVLLAGLALAPTYAQSALGGYVFGMTLGLPAALAGFGVGAWIGYEIGARASGDRVTTLIGEERRGFWRTLGTVMLLRCPPNSPFAIMNLVLASVKVPRGPYLLGTLLGMTPRTALYVFVGAGLHEAFTKDNLSAAAPKWMIWAAVAAAVVVIVVFAGVSNRALERAGLSGKSSGG